MSIIRKQPGGEPISNTIARLVELLDSTEALTGPQVGDVVVFLKQLLPDLHAFAQAMEHADRQLTSAKFGLMACAADQLFEQLKAPRQLIAADRAPRCPLTLLGQDGKVVDLESYRRTFNGGAA